MPFTFDIDKWTESQCTAVIVNGMVIICSVIIAVLYRNERKFIIRNVAITIANMMAQVASIYMTFAGTYLAVYIAGYFSQIVFLASSLQMVEILNFFKFLSPSITVRRITYLRIFFVTVFIINEILMFIGLPFVLAKTIDVAPGIHIRTAIRGFVLFNSSSQAIFYLLVTIYLTRKVYTITRENEILTKFDSNDQRAVKERNKNYIGKVYINTMVHLGFLFLIYVIGNSTYALFSTSNRLAYMVLSFGAIGTHSIGTIIVIHNFSVMISTHFGHTLKGSSGNSGSTKV